MDDLDAPPPEPASGPAVDQYGGSFFDVYDQWYPPQTAASAVAFIASRFAAGNALLELGVGTGRVALPLAREGLRVTGLDASQQMLDVLQRNAADHPITTILGDAADERLYPTEEFDGVIAVFNLLFNLSDTDAQRRCIAAVGSSLRTGGLAIVEAFVPAVVTERRADLVTKSVSATGVVLIATETDPQHQRVAGSHIELTDGNVKLRPWQLQLAQPGDIDLWASAAGLELVERYEDFESTPYVDGDSAHHVSVYRKT